MMGKIMKHAINAYELLSDSFAYACRSWLRVDLAPGSEADAKAIAAAASFLLDNLFAKEDAGEEISRLAYEELGDRYDPKALRELATKLRLALAGEEFAAGKSPLRDYLAWIASEEKEVLTAFADNYGKLALVTMDEYATLLCVEHPEIEKLRIAEIVFLNLTEAFRLIYQSLLGPAFSAVKSAPYFRSVCAQFAAIRADIED